MAKLFDLGLSNVELWRSEEMQLVQVGVLRVPRWACVDHGLLPRIFTPPSFVHPLQLMVPAESAHDTIGALGDVGLLQFKDLNADKSAFQRTYANQVLAGVDGWGCAAAPRPLRWRCVPRLALSREQAAADLDPPSPLPTTTPGQAQR